MLWIYEQITFQIQKFVVDRGDYVHASHNDAVLYSTMLQNTSSS